MNKKSKIIIVVSVIIIIVTSVGFLSWGLQPVQRDEVSLEKLNKMLGDRYCMPSELPFAGEVKCYIIYIEGHMGVVLTRFEASSKRSTGYSIEIKDGKRKICIETSDSITINAEGLLTEDYNNKTIKYLFIETETDNTLSMIFEINSKTYYISAAYNKDVHSEILKSDIKCLLNQMITK